MTKIAELEGFEIYIIFLVLTFASDVWGSLMAGTLHALFATTEVVIVRQVQLQNVPAVSLQNLNRDIVSGDRYLLVL